VAATAAVERALAERVAATMAAAERGEIIRLYPDLCAPRSSAGYKLNQGSIR